MTRNSQNSSAEKWVADHVAGLPRSGIRDFFELVNSFDDVISLGVGEPDFDTPWSIREATIYAIEKGHTSYTSNLGLLSLRTAVCDYLARDFSLTYDPETECIITVGVSEALDLILRTILNPGDELIYHEPCYVSYAPLIEINHAKPVAVVTTAENGFRVDPAAVEKVITDRTKAILLNYPNNPTGAGLDLPAKQAIAELAIRHDIVVITDEIYSELTYDERDLSIAALPGMKERTVFLHGFSKAFAMTGFRIGYACGPRDLIDAMMKIHQYSMLCASIIGQEAAIEALRSAHKEMAAMRDQYRQRRNLIVKSMNDMGLPCAKPDGAFYVFPDIRSSGMSSHEFAHKLIAEEQVAVVPGTAFGDCGEGHIRCAYAANIEDIEEAMTRIKRFLGKR